MTILDPSVAREHLTAAARSERRGAPRLAAYGTRLFVDDQEVALLNLSRDGLAIEGGRELEIGRNYVFTLLGDSGERPSFAGRVVWCRIDESSPSARFRGHAVYRAGIRRFHEWEAAQAG